MAIKNCYKSRVAHSQYILRNGKSAPFIGGEYYTDIPEEIEELDNEIRLGHPSIYVDKDKKTVDTDKLDPHEEIKRKAVEDYKKTLAAATDPRRDMGKTEPQKLVPASSATVGVAAENSYSGSSAGARLANLGLLKKS